MKSRISVVVPCYNEQGTIVKLLNAIYSQTFPIDQIEVIVADGQSNDGTLIEIKNFQESHPLLLIKIVENRKRTIPAALNLAINNSSSEIIVRLDAHSIPNADYIERSVSALDLGLGDNVGGKWNIKPGKAGWIPQSISLATSHPLGAGDASYRIGGKAKLVDTIPFGTFYRELFMDLGGFDESLLANEDYEFNARIRQRGGKVWFDPSIESVYFARHKLIDLYKQYWRYGFWKYRMLQLHPKTLRWRQLLPPLFVLSIIILFIFALIDTFYYLVIIAELTVYGMSLIFAGMLLANKHSRIVLVIGVPLAIAGMHISWGSAFLWSKIYLIFRKKGTLN